MGKIGTRLRSIRENMGMSLNDFSSNLGISTSTLFRYEKGDGFPDSELLAMLCENHNINPAWLLLGEGEMSGRNEPEKSIIAGVERSKEESKGVDLSAEVVEIASLIENYANKVMRNSIKEKLLSIKRQFED